MKPLFIATLAFTSLATCLSCQPSDASRPSVPSAGGVNSETSRNLENSSGCTHDETTFRCVKVLKNYDGDTITVNIPGVPPLIGKNISVRVLGIDTPEIKTTDKCEKEAGRRAKNLVAAKLRNAKKVELHNIQRDKYFRILADVQVDGTSISQVLLKNKLALPYDGGTKSHPDWCQVLRRPAAND